MSAAAASVSMESPVDPVLTTRPKEDPLKTLLACLVLLMTAVSHAQGATPLLDDSAPAEDPAPEAKPKPAEEVPPPPPQLDCWELGEFIDPVVIVKTPARCTCDGVQYISVGGVVIGGSAPGSNGGIVPDCYLHTISIPGYYEAKPGGPVNLRPVAEPIIIEIRGCDTDDCYWFFGSASCELETSRQAGFRVSYRVVGACSEVRS